jgi:uncharacterized protein (DUF1330 family)
MSGYIFANVRWTNEEARQAYLNIQRPSLEAHGAVQVTVSQEAHVMDGDWQPNGIIVLISFPAIKDALTWYNSEEYRPALEILRQWASPRVLIFGD